MTADEARDVQDYLDQFQLGISEIGELEKCLKAKLAGLEKENIEALFGSEHTRADIIEKIDDAGDRLTEVRMERNCVWPCDCH